MKEILERVRGSVYYDDSVSLAAHVVLCTAVVALVILLGKLWLDTPTVIFNARDNSCVKVDFAAPEFNCWNLPKRYETEWVNK